MNFILRKALIATACVGFALPTIAADIEPGWYLGGGIGEFNVEIDDVDDIEETVDRYDTDDTAYRAFVGYRVNPYLAAEVAYINLGNPESTVFTDTVLQTEIDGFAPSIVGVLPIGPLFEVFGKAGYYFYDQEVTASSPLGRVETSKDAEDFLYSAGAGLNIGQHFNVRLEYEWLDVEDTDETESAWLTAAWKF
jgi:opacity protein-like surface antigen